MKFASICILFVHIIIETSAQPNIIWNIPNASPKAGSTASISAAFLDAAPTTLFSVYIVSASGDILDVVAANQTGSGAAAVWHIPANFPGGTYQVRVDANANAVSTPYIAPTRLTVSAGVPSSNCSIQAFRPQTPDNFAVIQVLSPEVGSLVGLPPVDSVKPGEFNVQYLWKVDDALNGWAGASSLYIDVLAIKDASIPPGNQVPVATVAQATVVPPTVSTKVAPIVIPTMSAVKNFLGPAAVRINYTIGTGGVRSVYSQNFFLGKNCNGKNIGEGSTNSTFTSPGATSGIVVNVDSSSFTAIIVGAVVGAVVFTLIVVFLVLWLVRRRRRAARKSEANAGGYN